MFIDFSIRKIVVGWILSWLNYSVGHLLNFICYTLIAYTRMEVARKWRAAIERSTTRIPHFMSVFDTKQ